MTVLTDVSFCHLVVGVTDIEVDGGIGCFR
jgi:hypothetical protein